MPPKAASPPPGGPTVSNRAVARSKGCPNWERASQTRARSRSTGRASCLITRNEKRTTPGAKSESPATTETSSPGRFSRDCSEPGAPAALRRGLWAPQPGATTVPKTAMRTAPDAQALLGRPLKPGLQDRRERSSLHMTPRGGRLRRRRGGRPSFARASAQTRFARSPREIVAPHDAVQAESSPGPRGFTRLRSRAGLVTVEGAAAVEHAGHRAAAVERAGDVLNVRMRRILCLSETGQRPCSSSEGAKQENESRLFHMFTSFRR